MKNFKIFKPILCLLLIVSLSLSLFGCVLNDVEDDPIESGTDTNGATDTETETDIPNYIKYDKVKDYQIIEDEDGYYLVFDDISVYETPNTSRIFDTDDYFIDSWEEFSERLLNGELTFYEKSNIVHATVRDDNGLSILNPYCSYKVSHTLPHKADYDGAFLGCAYAVWLNCEKYPHEHFQVFILNKLGYYQEYNYVFEDYVKDENKLEYEIELSNGEIVKCYNKIIAIENNETKEMYVLSNGIKDVFVLKSYKKNDTFLYITLFYNINDTVYFFVNDCNYDHEIPDDEFWFGFNVEVVDNAQTA